MRIDKQGISLRGMKTIFTIPWEQVADISIDGPEHASRRVTAGRVAMLGVFALAAKKSSKSAIIFVDTISGDQAVFETAKALPHEIAPKLAPLSNQARKYAESRRKASDGSVPGSETRPVPVTTAPTATISVADEIAELAELHQNGILNDAEFAALKTKLLNA